MMVLASAGRDFVQCGHAHHISLRQTQPTLRNPRQRRAVDEELSANQARLAPHIEEGDEPRILVIVGEFLGWERGGDWTNLDFMFSHGAKIARIAFVGEKKWEDQLKMFVGAGFRSAPVGYFETGREEIARAWLLQ